MVDLSNYTWIVIITSYLAFSLGIVLCYSSWKTFHQSTEFSQWLYKDLYLFNDNGKFLLKVTYILSLIGIIAAIHHWIILIREYGSFFEVFARAQRIYHFREDNSIPYIWLSSYIAVFLSAIYSAYAGKFHITAFYSILGVSLKSMAYFTRSGILLGLLEFIFGFVLFRNVLNSFEGQKFVNRKKIIITILISCIIMTAAASIVKISRETMDEKVSGLSNQHEFDGNLFLTPSIYFYLSSQVATLSEYLEYDNENHLPAEYLLLPIYRVLGNFDIVEKPNFNSKGYRVPVWTNTATYLRNFHSDFGILGLLIGPFIIGFLSSYFWIRLFYYKEIIYIIYLTFIMVVIGMSFFVLQSQTAFWASIISSVAIFKYIKKKKSNIIYMSNDIKHITKE